MLKTICNISISIYIMGVWIRSRNSKKYELLKTEASNSFNLIEASTFTETAKMRPSAISLITKLLEIISVYYKPVFKAHNKWLIKIYLKFCLRMSCHNVPLKSSFDICLIKAAKISCVEKAHPIILFKQLIHVIFGALFEITCFIT